MTGKLIDVSVVVPTRNRSGLLMMTLRSVLSQQGVNVEVIVVDEGSSDDTSALLAGLDDPRIRVIRHDTPQGLPAARNHGAAEARAEWLAFIDDDDLWAPDKLARQLQAARETGCEWVYAGAVNILDGHIVYGERPLPPDQVVLALQRSNAIPGGGSNVIIRRSLWLRAGPFDTRFPGGGEDWEMSLRLAKHGSPAWVCSPLVARRLHATNMSLDLTYSMTAARLIEALHQTKVDWGRMHLWFAYSCLRAGRRRDALKQFANAARHHQSWTVLRELASLAQNRLQRLLRVRSPRAVTRTPWRATAAAWLGRLEVIR